MNVPYEELEFGFKYGAASITRTCSDEKKGWVVISLDTPKKQIQLYVTRTGKVRIFDNNEELRREKE